MSAKHLAAFASAALLAVGAHATSSVSASLTDFQLTVNQGQMSWSSELEDSALFVRLYANASDVSLVPTNDVMAFGGLFADATLSATGTVSQGSASATANSLSISLSTPAAGGSAYAFASWTSHFDLAAQSTVTFSWVAHNSGAIAGAAGSGAYGEVAFGDVLNDATVEGQGYWPGTDTLVYHVDGAAFQFWSDGGRQYASVSSGDQGLDGVGFFARVQGHTVDVASAVPEPEGMALALCGLGIVGAASLAGRRRA